MRGGGFKVISYNGSKMESKKDFYEEPGTAHSSRINLGMVNDQNDMESKRDININELQALLGN